MSAARNHSAKARQPPNHGLKAAARYWLDPGDRQRARLADGDERRQRALRHHHRLSVARHEGLPPRVPLGSRTAVCLAFPSCSPATSIESIYDLCEAVDWIEREIHEGFAIDFTGREYEPLLLRQGDTPA